MSEPNRFGGSGADPGDPWRAPGSAEPPPFFTTPNPAPAPGPGPYQPPPANPYAPAAVAPPSAYPSAYPSGYPPVGASPYAGPALAVRANKGLGIATLVLGGVFLGYSLLRAATAPSAIHKLDLYAAAGYDTRRVATAHDGVAILGIVLIPLFIVGSLWLYRAQANARAISPHQVRRALAWSWFG